MGTCVYHVAHQGLGGWLKRVGRNAEMPNFTQALYDARELAMERMQAEAEALEAEGIVGVDPDRGQPRLGLARARVLLGRHGGDADERGPPHRGARARAQPQRRRLARPADRVLTRGPVSTSAPVSRRACGP